MQYDEIVKNAKKIDIKKLQDSHITLSGTMKKSVEIYNSAVSNIQFGNMDIAIIKLRKAQSLQPGFQEATKLLSMLKSLEKPHSEDDKIKKTNEKIGKRDPVLHPIINSKGKTLPERLHINPRTLMKLIITTIMVIIIVVMIVVISKLVNKEDEGINPDVATVNQLTVTVNQLSNQIDDLTSQLEDKNETLNENTTKLVVLEEQLLTTNQLLDLYMAKSYYSDGKYTLAAEILMSLEEVVFEDEHLGVYNQVYLGAMAESAKSVYMIGVNLFQQQDYQRALDNLLQVKIYDSNFSEMDSVLIQTGKTYYELDRPAEAIETYKELDLNYPEYPKDSILYNTGKAYMKLNDYEQALIMFNLILTDYPDSSLIGYAKDKIKEIGNK